MNKLAMLCAAAALALSAIACNQTPYTRDADAAALKANEAQSLRRRRRLDGPRRTADPG
jgi:hypothetical protein